MSEALELELSDDIDVGNSIWVPWKIRLVSNSRSFCLSYNNIHTQLQISFADGHNCIHFNPNNTSQKEVIFMHSKSARTI